MESSTLHSNLSATPLPAVLNRPRFYDDLEPMSPCDSLYNGEYDSYKVQNATPLINDDDMICGWEEPQKKLKVQENKGIIVGSGNKSGESSNTRTHDIKVSLNKDQVPKNRRNCVQPSISQVINIDDDEEDEDVVELISDEECIIVEKPNKNKAVKSPSLVMKENVSGIYTAIAKKRIEEEEYRRAVEHRQQQYFLSLRMRQYMYFMAQQNRMQGAQQQWNGLLNSANQFAYDQTIGNNKSEDQSTSAATSVSHEQRFQPLQISITLDKETDFDFLEQQEEYDDSNAQNIITLEQKFYLKQSNLNVPNELVKRKRGRPRKYKPLDENVYQESNDIYQEDSPQTTRIIKTTKKQKEIETVVGEEFQVRILPYTLNTKKQNIAKRAPKSVWNPELIQKDALDTYMADLSRVTRQEISNEETALDLLKGCGMDIAKTLEVVRKNKQLYRKVFEVAVRTSSDPKV